MRYCLVEKEKFTLRVITTDSEEEARKVLVDCINETGDDKSLFELSKYNPESFTEEAMCIIQVRKPRSTENSTNFVDVTLDTLDKHNLLRENYNG